MMNDLPEEMDACLESQLEIVRNISYERHPLAASAARARFLKDAEKARQAFYQDADSSKAQTNPVAKWWSGLFPSFARAALAFGIALVVVIGGTAGVVFASQSSLPGDWMYPVKLWGDDLRIDLTADPAEQLDLEIQIAAERLQEMQYVQTLQQTRNQPTGEKEIPASEQAYAGIYKHLDEALLLAQQLYADDPEMLAQITAQIEQQLLMLEDMNPSAIIQELQELRKELRDQLKELKKADPEPPSDDDEETTTEEDVPDTGDDDKDKEDKDDDDTGDDDKDKEDKDDDDIGDDDKDKEDKDDDDTGDDDKDKEDKDDDDTDDDDKDKEDKDDDDTDDDNDKENPSSANDNSSNSSNSNDSSNNSNSNNSNNSSSSNNSGNSSNNNKGGKKK